MWWDAYAPEAPELADVPAETRVAIIGAGYAGLAAALELTKLGIEATVFDAGAPGFGASTRSGGLVGGSASVKKPLLGRAPAPQRAAAMMSDAADGFHLVEKLITDEQIDCGWSRSGRFTGAWSAGHYRAMAAQAKSMNELAEGCAYVVSKHEQRKEIGSDFYHGGLVSEEAAHLHPALYFKGLKDACTRRGITLCAKAEVQGLGQEGEGWRLKTSRGETLAGDVVVATNGYTCAVTPAFQRRLSPLQAYIIATEALPADLAQALSPRDRSFADSKRIVSFFRLSSDKRRMIFGSRVKWRDITPTEMAPLLYDLMTARYPVLQDFKLTHAWTGNVALTLDEEPHMGNLRGLHFALGCNGSGVAMMTYMGTQIARKIAGAANYAGAFDSGRFPTHPLYNGRSRWFLPLIGNYLRFRDWWDRRPR